MRQEEAVLLGYSSYSEMVLEGRMAKNPATVQKFENSLIGKISQQSVAEKQKLIDFKRQITNDPKAEMH
jgi:Zn-dependent oligopeptidase|tara:strand:- start:98 stop:304 length:207 start_codon:yes stop_codon:yes gene_type:complete